MILPAKVDDILQFSNSVMKAKSIIVDVLKGCVELFVGAIVYLGWLGG